MYIFARAQQILRNMNLKLIALTKTALMHVFKSIKKKISTSQTQRKKRISLSIINHLFIYSFSLHLSVFKAFEIISNIGLSEKAIQNPFSTSCKSIQMNLKHFCFSCGIRVLNNTESARYCVFRSGLYPYTSAKKFMHSCLS